MRLVWPSRAYLPGYVAALERGWSPDNVRGQAAAQEELERIAADPDGFLASLVDRDAAKGGVLIEEFVKPAALGGKRGRRYRVNILEGV